MPFINVKTNVSVSQDKADAVKSALGQAITTIPGKSESWLMVGIEPDYILYFQGSDSPAAIAEVSIFGGASSSAYDTLTGRISDILENALGITQDRIYVRYTETENWGWNGSNF
ncbi:MAG: hypothetical protein J6L99_04435 [Ruminococcus sp.]|jgi:phenylpyruvate tautomerase PptA (4-oxalocrotonate tautomerase family)|nr:hypothetical protein [Ruminococcus sp.]MBQ1464585.1 hypothetical protein [Ruminococcus sp.]